MSFPACQCCQFCRGMVESRDSLTAANALHPTVSPLLRSPAPIGAHYRSSVHPSLRSLSHTSRNLHPSGCFSSLTVQANAPRFHCKQPLSAGGRGRRGRGCAQCSDDPSSTRTPTSKKRRNVDEERYQRYWLNTTVANCLSPQQAAAYRRRWCTALAMCRWACRCGKSRTPQTGAETGVLLRGRGGTPGVLVEEVGLLPPAAEGNGQNRGHPHPRMRTCLWC